MSEPSASASDEPIPPEALGDPTPTRPTPEPLAELEAAAASPEVDSPERQELESEPSTRCLNCGRDLPGAYCPTCGQKDQPLRQPVHRFVIEAVAEYIGLDGRLWPTLGTLLFKPGRLTQAYVLGRRMQFVRPLRIYITASLFFFFLLALIDPIGRVSENVDQDPMADTTMTVATYVVHVDSLLAEGADRVERQRQVVDSIRVVEATELETFEADSLAGAFVNTDSLEAARDVLDALADDVEDEEDELDDRIRSKTTQRLLWQKEQLESLPADSTIRPDDFDVAAELMFSTSTGTNLNGPEWMLGSPAVQRLKNARTSDAQKDAAFGLGREALDKVPTVVFILLPVFALLLKLVYVRRGWYYSEHLVFALHVHAYAFSIYSVSAFLFWLMGGSTIADALGALLGLTIPIYFVVAQKRVYAQGWIKTLLKSGLLGWMYSLVLIGGLVLAILLAAALG